MNKLRISARIFNSLLPVLLAFFIGGMIILFLKENPFRVYGIMMGKSLFSIRGFLDTLHYASPLVLTGFAIAVTFKANIFNMGVEGQMLLGGFFAGVIGAFLPVANPVLHKLLCILTGMSFGVLFAMIPAALKACFRVDEMVVTLTLNYAMAKLLEYLASGPFCDKSIGFVGTPIIANSAMFLRLGPSRFTVFAFLALTVFLILWFVMSRTTLGYEIHALGSNSVFAEAVGIRTRRKILILMALSGALAGMAGAGNMLSEQYRYTLAFSGSPGLGWDGMLIALLGRHSPVGILIAAILYAALKTGADKINMYTSVPKEIVTVIQGLIILFLAIRFINERFGIWEHIKRRKTGRMETA
ncbi:MAG: ABC transporter permease [Spirochaetaceae bacterium]|jgi:simple sugar transport system permease protein|nr:ABC transporter permease [Spirochaetaceae bacterium]